MIEREMEDLIAQFPNEFFPDRGFVLKGRQQSFAGIGRFDLLFVDSYGSQVLMELKAGVAKYENASQLAKYKEALETKGEANILMWLVAAQIPNPVREFLDRIGIEYSEIHEVQFKRVAERHGIPFQARVPETASVVLQTHQSAPSSRPGILTVAGEYQLRENLDKDKLESLIQSFESAAKRRIDVSLALKLRKEVLERNPPSLSLGTVKQLAKWCKTSNPVYWDGMEVARKISEVLFGRVLDRDRLGV
jgi:antitoxin component of RelBE/YafQ-DinJ toxin-antitoxin module